MTAYNKVVIICIVGLLATGIFAFDYCELKSCPGKHTMCKYKDKVACPGDKVKSGMNLDQRKALLDLHNALRQRVAQGKEPGQAPASNMMKMYWDNEVEMIAQRWTNQCVKGHDECRDLKNGTSSGQNFAQGNLNLKKGANSTLLAEDCFNMWYGEIKDVTPDMIEKFSGSYAPNGNAIGHYTALVYADSKALGCGYLATQPANEYFQEGHVICNYSPAGNYLGAPLYKTGEACSACPKDTRCSTRWPGLCTGEKDEYDDIPPSRGVRSDSTYLLITCVFLFKLLLNF